MKSKTYFINSAAAYVRNIIRLITHDKVTVYAAQASFFVITSSVPFISMLIALASLFLPENSTLIYRLTNSGDLTKFDYGGVFSTVINEIQKAPGVSLLSFSAVTTLWSASKGISAVRSGIETVYSANSESGFVTHRLKSILVTLIFIVLLTLLSVLLLFGDLLTSLFGGRFTYVMNLLRIPMLAVLMALFFTLFYVSVAHRSVLVSRNFFRHLPGAMFASVGWLLFSYFYSLYLDHFPGASRIYGGLAAICLIMLWLYFCMIILLLGAEINKLYFASRKFIVSTKNMDLAEAESQAAKRSRAEILKNRLTLRSGRRSDDKDK